MPTGGAFGGLIAAESVPGVGNTFTLKVRCGELKEVEQTNGAVRVKPLDENATASIDSLTLRVLGIG